MELKLEFCERAIKHLDALSPSQLFNSFDNEILCKDLMERLLKESFKNKDIDVVELIRKLVDNKIIIFDFCFKVSLFNNMCTINQWLLWKFPFWSHTTIFQNLITNSRNSLAQVVFEQCLESGDIDTVRAVSRYREEYLEENYWLELSEKYVQVYFQSATDINHPYIQLVRLVLCLKV